MRVKINPHREQIPNALNPIILEDDTGKEQGMTINEAFKLAGELIAIANQIIQENQKKLSERGKSQC